MDSDQSRTDTGAYTTVCVYCQIQMQNEYLEFGYLLEFEDDRYLLLIDSLILY